MDHQGEDAHLGGTAVVELDGELLVEGGLIPTRGLDLGSLDVCLAEREAVLQKTERDEELERVPDGQVLEGSQTRADIRERHSAGKSCEVV